MSNKQIKVMLVSRESTDNNSIWLKQFPNNEPKWNNCYFITNPNETNYDWFVCRNDIPYIYKNKINLNCNLNKTILFTTEPSSITRYGKKFAQQFGYLLTSQEKNILPHINAIRSPTGNVWHYGKSYDKIINQKPIHKNKRLSTVCSTKQMKHTIHANRLKFTNKLKGDISILDLYGKGHNYIEKKYQAIDPYEFHLAIENYSAPHHFTEKLTDAFLGYSVPIYYGCSNVYDYFPEESIILIDIYDYKASLKKIQSIINNKNEYNKRFDAIVEARNRVLKKYNLPSLISSIIETEDKKIKNELIKKNFYSRRAMRAKHPSEFLSYINWKIKNI